MTKINPINSFPIPKRWVKFTAGENIKQTKLVDNSREVIDGRNGKMVFEEIKSSTDRIWDINEEKVFEGVLESMEKSQYLKGDGTPRMNYIFREEKGSVLVWGSSVLDKLEAIELNSKLRIEFLGEVKAKSGMMYRDFKVSIDK